jgi:hypothetical protein
MRNHGLDCEALNGPAPYQVRRTIERHEPLAQENSTLERVQARDGHLGARLRQNRHRRHQRRTILLIITSRAGSPRPPEDSQMPRRERLAATPHRFTDQRLEGWCDAPGF